MTERFTLSTINKNYSIVLNGAYNIVDDGNILEGKEVVDLLNELVDENEKLKELNIPINEIKETVLDYKGRVVGVYYND